MTALQSFKEIYQSNRESKKQEYISEEIVEIDFKKTNGKFKGEDSEKASQYIYLMKSNGYSFSEIAMLIEITKSSVFRRYYAFKKDKNL